MPFRWETGGVAFALAAAVALTALSFSGLCETGCSATKDYRLFGTRFEWVGLGVFGAASALFALSFRFPAAGSVLGLVLAAAVGAELWFLFLQKFVIGRWCKVCLGIAASVGVASVCFVAGNWRRKAEEVFEEGGQMARGGGRLARNLVVAAAFVAVGWITAFAGVEKRPASAGITPVIGNGSSPVEVYVFTDWFCPACQKVEEGLDGAYPSLAKRAKMLFIDYPVHPETMNFVPYHLSFMVFEKERYFEIRKALSRLSRTNKDPSAEDVQSAVDPLGVKYRQMNFARVAEGMKFFEAVIKAFRVTGTPTVVVRNVKTEQWVKLDGVLEISEKSISAAIAKVSPR